MVDQATILLEPVERNTAPSLALAALAATEAIEDPCAKENLVWAPGITVQEICAEMAAKDLA